MKKITLAMAAAVAFMAAPAAANEFVGPRAEVTVGADDMINTPDGSDVTYGVAVGYDVEAVKNVTVGGEVSVDNVFTRRNIGASVRLGYALNDNVLVYTKAGYANYKDVFNNELDGFRVGGGVDLALAGPFYTKIEYRYTDFENEAGQHAGLVGVGIRF